MHLICLLLGHRSSSANPTYPNSCSRCGLFAREGSRRA